MKLDNRYQDQEAWLKAMRELPLGLNEVRWRAAAHDLACGTDAHIGVVRPEPLERMADEHHNHWYLEPDDLEAPWTPELLLAVAGVEHIVSDYRYEGEPDPEVPSMTRGERKFESIITSLRAAGLDSTRRRKGASWEKNAPEMPWNWVAWAEERREVYRRRARWLGSEMVWDPFQVDTNALGFYTVDAPHVWQVVVDKAREEKGSEAMAYLRDMRMGSLKYIRSEIPGPHEDLTRKHLYDVPLGYGVSTEMPTFGYRREHTSPIPFFAWAAVHEMDLFNEDIW